MNLAHITKTLLVVSLISFLVNGCGGGGSGTDADADTNQGADTSPYTGVISSDNALQVVKEVFSASAALRLHYGVPRRPTMIMTGTTNCPISGSYTVEYNNALNIYYNKCVAYLNMVPDTQTYTDGHKNWAITSESGSPWRYDVSWTTNAVFDSNLVDGFTGRIMVPAGDGGFKDGGSGEQRDNIIGVAQFYGSYNAITDKWVEAYSGTDFLKTMSLKYTSNDGQSVVINTSTDIQQFNITNTELVTSTSMHVSFEKDRDFTLVLKDNTYNLSATYNVATAPVFSGSGDASLLPHQGMMTISGASNTKVNVIANSDETVTLVINDSVSKLVKWTDISVSGW